MKSTGFRPIGPLILSLAMCGCHQQNSAMTQLTARANQGDAEAEFDLAKDYDKGAGVDQDYATAASWYRKAAEQGNIKAQNNLAVMYAHGIGVATNQAEAVKWFQKAAEQGAVQAQMNLAVILQTGAGVPKDLPAAIKWYKKAAEQGQVDAQTELARIYYFGEGERQDYAEAAKWARKAAEQGSVAAQNTLGSLLESTGPGAPPTNLKEAFHWFELSAKGGYPRAQFNVARFYLNGFGVTDKNRAKAYMWLRLGAENGEAAAINLLAESKGVFSESEISEGKKLLAAYKGGQTQAKASPSPM